MMYNLLTIMRLRLFAPALLFLFCACGATETPLDAETRKAIDSISNVSIRIERASLDSLCRQNHATVLPHLIDSLRQVRLGEIERQLKTVPK